MILVLREYNYGQKDMSTILSMFRPRLWRLTGEMGSVCAAHTALDRHKNYSEGLYKPVIAGFDSTVVSS